MAYICSISKIEQMEGKDKIAYAHFNENGYGVICDKSFTEGEKIIYCEVDSILPVRKEFEFLRNRCYKDKLNGFLIKNMKMKDSNGTPYYSNGIIFHVDELFDTNEKFKVGQDVTEKLEVRKYEPEDDASPIPEKKSFIKDFLLRHKCTRWLGKILFFKRKAGKGDFPTEYISKSDEDNIQNNKQWFDKFKHTGCYITTKLEGQSETILFLPKHKKLGEYRVYGRNSIGSEAMWKLASKISADKKLKQAFKDTHKIYAIQGERTCPEVQKGIYKNGEHFNVYKVKDVLNGETLGYNEMTDFCIEYGFECVPILVILPLGFETMFKSIEEMQEFVEHQWFKVGSVKTGAPNFDDRDLDKGQNYSKPEMHRQEGIVIRGLNNEFSFKCKSNEYKIDFDK